MAVFNPVLRMETGLLVSGEEYMGFLPEKLDTVSGEMSSISFRPGTVNSGGGYIILQDYSNNYLVIPAVVKGETHEVMLKGSDSSRGAVICTYPSGRLSLNIINVSCKDASKPVSLYVKAYGYGRMGNKTSSGWSQALQTVKVTITGFGAYYTNANQELVAIPYPNPSPTEVYDVLKGSIIVGLGGATIFNTTLTRLSPYAAAAENDGLITFNPASGG